MTVIISEAEALDAMAAMLIWAQDKPDSTHGGPTTGLTYQRGRVIVTWTHDGTLGASTYLNARQAREKAADMERAYRNWRGLRDRE